ncbi:EAL domain-containing protein [bacterium]|nr:EAL domain-containing protein [bacterium]MBU1993948.1 EAL domain-containing protein [bacterium]
MNSSIQQCLVYSKELKVLYVEDNADARMFTLEMLKRFFNHITVAKDGEEGLECFKKDTFDVVLTDIHMPKLNGLKMAEKMKRISNSIIILVLSAHNESEFFISSIKIGIDGYLLKPLEIHQFVDVMKKAIEKIYLQNEIKNYQAELESANRTLEKKVKERTSELEYRLYHDHLTDLGNHEAMVREISSTRCNILFLIDIDGFQKFNDIYGLHAGNTILKKFAVFLNAFNNGKKYSMFRVYGDGFVLYSAENNVLQTSFEEEKQRLLTYLESVKIYLTEIDEAVDIDVTIGVCIEKENPFIKADMALKYAKKQNKRLILYTEEIDSAKQFLEDMYWKAEIKTAIQNDNIIPVFQAIVDKNAKIVKYETLMRLVQYENSNEKYISPVLFLEAAVKTQQYDKLTRIIVKKCFEKMKDYSIDFSINLSLEDFSDSARVQFLHDEILRYKVGKRLIMEILESEVIKDYEVVIGVLEGFRKLGVRIAIDDFGSGFSNFEHILKLNPDYIKIDGSLIKNILEDEKSFTLVRAISEFSKELGIKVIAEFVSSKEIFETLSAISIDQYQGYYFSIPSKDLATQRNN